MNISKQAIEAGAEALGVLWSDFDAPIPSDEKEAEVVLRAAIPHLRGEGKRAEASTPPACKESLQVEPNPDDVERVARAMFDDDVRYYNWKIVWEKIEARKEYLRCATAAIRAMRGQLWGVFSGNGLVLDKSTFARFVSHDRQLLEMVCRVFDEKYPSVKHEVRPYTAPREESAEEIAMSILTPPMFYSESFMKDAQARVAQAIREAEKRGAGKAVEHGA